MKTWMHLLRICICLVIVDLCIADDFLGSLESVVSSVIEYMVEDECKYTCRGAKPRKKPGHIPTSNGCGSLGIKLDFNLVPSAERCCDVHDKCYDTCNNKKEQCDLDFQKCLNKICTGLKQYLSNDVYEGCSTVADAMYVGTLTMGCKSYRDAQQNACVCAPKEEL